MFSSGDFLGRKISVGSVKVYCGNERVIFPVKKDMGLLKTSPSAIFSSELAPYQFVTDRHGTTRPHPPSHKNKQINLPLLRNKNNFITLKTSFSFPYL